MLPETMQMEFFGGTNLSNMDFLGRVVGSVVGALMLVH
jgi:hypothetical protein